MHLDRIVWNRSTYSLLDLLGDLGGLSEALVVMSRILIACFASFNIRATLANKFFKVKKRTKSFGKKISASRKGKERLMSDLDDWKDFPVLSYFRVNCFNFFQRR